MNIVALTDVGRHRTHNEDFVATGGSGGILYAIVADGMGGHLAGEIASEMAVNIVKESLDNIKDDIGVEELKSCVKMAYIDANSKIYEYAENNEKVMGMGTTLVCAVILKDKLIIANVGDSRAYSITEDEMEQLSRDHSFVQKLVDTGVITKEQAMHHPKRNYITRAMGTEEGIKTDVFEFPYTGQTVLLCSDGLCGLVTDEEIKNIVNADFEKAASELVKLANEKGGTDNITVALLKS